MKLAIKGFVTALLCALITSAAHADRVVSNADMGLMATMMPRPAAPYVASINLNWTSDGAGATYNVYSVAPDGTRTLLLSSLTRYWTNFLLTAPAAGSRCWEVEALNAGVAVSSPPACLTWPQPSWPYPLVLQ